MPLCRLLIHQSTTSQTSRFFFLNFIVYRMSRRYSRSRLNISSTWTGLSVGALWTSCGHEASSVTWGEDGISFWNIADEPLEIVSSQIRDPIFIFILKKKMILYLLCNFCMVLLANSHIIECNWLRQTFQIEKQKILRESIGKSTNPSDESNNVNGASSSSDALVIPVKKTTTASVGNGRENTTALTQRQKLSTINSKPGSVPDKNLPVTGKNLKAPGNPKRPSGNLTSFFDR